MSTGTLLLLLISMIVTATQYVFAICPQAGGSDKISVLGPFVILNGRKLLIKTGVMALDKGKSPFRADISSEGVIVSRRQAGMGR